MCNYAVWGLLRLIQKGHWASSALVGVEHDLCSGIGVTRRHHDIHTVDDGSLAADPEKKLDPGRRLDLVQLWPIGTPAAGAVKHLLHSTFKGLPATLHITSGRIAPRPNRDRTGGLQVQTVDERPAVSRPLRRRDNTR